jgi:hypothetical protein
MKRDPLRGLSAPARAFVICVAVVLMAVFGLAIVSTFVFDFGLLTDFLRVIAVIGFVVFMLWGQWWFGRTTKEMADWRGGPLLRTLESTRAILDQERGRQHGPDSAEANVDGER